ncbi:MAG: hypothetical protein V6Z86_02500 [Hyphomicrobiales bacterium]
MADALAPLRSRMPQTVQEREVLRVVATVRGDDHAAAMDRAMPEVLAWAQNRSGGRLPQEAWDGQAFEYLAGGRITLGARIDGEGTTLWAVRGDDPDKMIAGRTWTTEVTLGRQGERLPQLSLRLLVSTAEEELSISPHVPGLMQQIAEKDGLSVEALPLAAQPWRIDTDSDVEDLIEMLESRDRRLPVLVVTGDERAEAPSINTDALARATLGLAHVVALPADRTYALSDAFGKIRSVYHGAARVYLPGFDAGSDPYEHRLILGDAIRVDPKRAVTELRRIAASESLRRTRLGHDVIAFAAVRSVALRIEQERRSVEGVSDTDQVEVLQRRLKALETEVVATKAEATQNFELAASEEERAKLAESQLHASRRRIQILQAQLSARGLDPDDELIIPRSWEDFAEWCDKNFVGRCVLSAAARWGVRKPQFQDVGLVGRCIRWLASTCLDRRINGGGSLANIPIEEGVENAPCGADTFEFDFQGRRLQADWHVKSGGNTRDPLRCLRIYYGFDAITQQIVIAEMPAHRRTGAS